MRLINRLSLITLIEPPGGLQAQDYCRRLNCLFWTTSQIMVRQDPSSVFLTTSVSMKRYFQPPGCNNLLPGTPGCKFDLQIPTETQRYFIADIERYTLLIRHTMKRSPEGALIQSNSLPGSLIGIDGKVFPDADRGHFANETRLESFPGDLMSLGTLLGAANVYLDDLSPAPDANHRLGETLRASGVSIPVTIKYQNEPLNPGAISYKYFPDASNAEVYGIEEAQYDPENGSYLVYQRHGIQLVFSQTGNLGRFSLLLLLTSLVAAFILLEVAKWLVNLLMLRTFRERRIYKKAKYSRTQTLRTIRERRSIRIANRNSASQAKNEELPVVNKPLPDLPPPTLDEEDEDRIMVLELGKDEYQGETSQRSLV
ncbi:hypothetical protein K493DRAFT_361585 [Basidiobolus meristosporus CBS 931.73]|uniref:Uncharacterized protein n=1 Tax=Basidiobolus meristosporus CBS 931.73 TaxID=1314790 RepID=A0A1Y1X8N2_9FUNG|nr:hypothetical protein K493DRAFT_361585 [Basidiobolus meristosporus CBS 931.73]|eukprot:ORX82087.1 hypothetical protein K493DRAFT_361585 [Basidiobolus meristosporus CBS 931.73]